MLKRSKKLNRQQCAIKSPSRNKPELESPDIGETRYPRPAGEPNRNDDSRAGQGSTRSRPALDFDVAVHRKTVQYCLGSCRNAVRAFSPLRIVVKALAHRMRLFTWYFRGMPCRAQPEPTCQRLNGFRKVLLCAVPR